MKTRSYKKALTLANVCMRDEHLKDLIWFVRCEFAGSLHTYSVTPELLRKKLIDNKYIFKWLSYSF